LNKVPPYLNGCIAIPSPLKAKIREGRYAYSAYSGEKLIGTHIIDYGGNSRRFIEVTPLAPFCVAQRIDGLHDLWLRLGTSRLVVTAPNPEKIVTLAKRVAHSSCPTEAAVEAFDVILGKIQTMLPRAREGS